jgi:hypothetical protein
MRGLRKKQQRGKMGFQVGFSAFVSVIQQARKWRKHLQVAREYSSLDSRVNQALAGAQTCSSGQCGTLDRRLKGRTGRIHGLQLPIAIPDRGI